MSCRTPGVRSLATMAVVGLACTLAACDSQVSPFYRGESLLTVTGSVEITEPRTPGRLVPALAFGNSMRNEVRIVEVEVQGKFPSDFRIDVYDPPPKEAFISTSELFDTDTKIALGYITAVPEHHRDVIRFADAAETSATACPSSGCASQPPSLVEASWCTSVGKVECYKETLLCPDGNGSSPDCKVMSSEGDRSLKEPWREFAGFSQNYVVIYLAEAASAGSWLAAGLGAPAGLERGYHLLALNTYDELKYQENAVCTGRAIDQAVERYNEQNATQYTADEAQGGCQYHLCGAFDTTCTNEPIGLCARPESERAAIVKQLGEDIRQAQLELDCLLIAPEYTPVADPEHASISVRIGAEAPPSQSGQVRAEQPPQP
jgi:hypothetical protein